MAGRIVDGPVHRHGVPHLISLVNDLAPERMLRLRAAAEEAARRHAVVAVVLSPVERPSLLADMYEAVVASIHLAPLARPQGGLVGPYELALYDLLASTPMASRTDFALGILGAVATIPSTKRDDLLETFEAWLWAGSAKAATRRLRGMSEPTVRYRLRRLEALTGYSLGAPTEALLLQVAVRIFRAWVEPLRRMDG